MPIIRQRPCQTRNGLRQAGHAQSALRGAGAIASGLGRPFHIYIPGVGGTGVITANAILAQAAAMDGHNVKSFDQTGAAQSGVQYCPA